MIRILVVDDLAANRAYLTSLLGYSGYSVLEASDGADALTIVRRERPDLIIADILMPIMDGYEFVRRLRSDAGIAHIPVVFYTAVYHEHETRQLAEACGVSHVLIKPCEPEVVLRTVHDALRDPAPPPAAPEEDTFRREHLRVVADKLTQTIEDLGFANERFGALIDINLNLGIGEGPRAASGGFMSGGPWSRSGADTPCLPSAAVAIPLSSIVLLRAWTRRLPTRFRSGRSIGVR
ncbi:MAG: response regulator [Gammaproteobacteria bacterium]|nr:response regulator [Gammaproteobacteria bacterium]